MAFYTRYTTYIKSTDLLTLGTDRTIVCTPPIIVRDEVWHPYSVQLDAAMSYLCRWTISIQVLIDTLSRRFCAVSLA